MPSLGHWKIPQIRSGRRSISVGKLLEKDRAGTLFKKHATDKIPGGLADDKKPGDFPAADLAKGLKVEREHTSSNAIATEIAMDHLTEDPEYYPKLQVLEGEGVPSSRIRHFYERMLERRGEHPDGSLKHAHKLDGETTFQGLDVAVENDVGSKRSGRNADGSRWTTRFKTPYGYLRGTTGADGEAVDCYVGPNPDATKAYVVHQKADDGSYDEDTVMLGYGSQTAAKSDILRHYSDPKYVGKIVPIAMERLKELVESKKKLVKISGPVKPGEWDTPAHLQSWDVGITHGGIPLSRTEANVAGGRFLRGKRLADPKAEVATIKKIIARVVRMHEHGVQSLPIELIARSAKKYGSVKTGFATKDPEYIEGDPMGTAGMPAPQRKRRGDVPSRDEVELNPTPKVEARGNNMETHLVGEFHSPGGMDDLGKFGAALSALGAMSEDWEGDSDVGLSLSAAREKEPRSPNPFTTLSEIAPVDDSLKMAMVRNAFLEELTKIAGENGVPPWAGTLEDFGNYVEAFQKLAFGAQAITQPLAGIGQAVKGAVGRLLPAGAAVHPDVAAMRKGVGFFSTGMGKDLTAGGKMLAHNPQAAGQAAGLGAKDLGSLQAMRPTSAGRRIAGETAMGAGHHMQHAGPGLMAMNPVGVPMGGAIEGFTRGVGKEMQGAASKGVQQAGRALVKHAPKVGFGGEFVAGGLLGTPGLGAMAGHQLAGMAGEHMMHAAHGLIPHTLGAGVQEASLAAPRVLPRMGGVIGQAAMGMKARAGHWGGKLVGA
jgi:hypothetical protein